MNTLILYSSTDGHTLSLCNYIADKLAGHGEQVLVENIADCSLNPADFNKVVIGASIRYGRHRPAVYDYIKKYSAELNHTNGLFFSVNLVARKPERAHVDTNPYLQKFLKEIPWQPAKVRLFAGKLNYPQYGFWDRWIIRFIMWLTKGPTDFNSVTDFTDWQAVDTMAEEIVVWSEDVDI